MHDLLAGLIGQVVERGLAAIGAEEPAVDLVHLPLVAAVDEEVVHDRGELVPGRAVHGPVGRELLVGPENLFDDEVDGAFRMVIGPGRESGGPRLQPPQVVVRREEAVDVIDAQPGRRASRQELEHELVDLVEHGRVFDPQRRELVHVEEPAVIDFFRGHVPVGQSVRLLVEQRVETVERARLALDAVEGGERAIDRVAETGMVRGERGQPAFDDFLLARSHRDRLRDRIRIGAADCAPP